MELLRDRSEELAEAGVHPYGISRDSAWTHIAWMQALDLNFPLLSDWNAEAVHGFGIALWPLDAALGHVRGWNVFVLLTYLAAGGLACLWLRELELPRGAALAGGLAFAIAPYRVAQSTGHLLGPISVLLPLALYAVERRRLALAAVAVASIPLSGQVHLALGAVPFVCAYALVRSRDRRMLLGVAATVAAAVGVGLLVKTTTIDHSHLASGRSLHAVSQYSAHWSDLVRRTKGADAERFVLLGWPTLVLAARGL